MFISCPIFRVEALTLNTQKAKSSSLSSTFFLLIFFTSFHSFVGMKISRALKWVPSIELESSNSNKSSKYHHANLSSSSVSASSHTDHPTQTSLVNLLSIYTAYFASANIPKISHSHSIHTLCRIIGRKIKI